jgi:hypothetical protein
MMRREFPKPGSSYGVVHQRLEQPGAAAVVTQHGAQQPQAIVTQNGLPQPGPRIASHQPGSMPYGANVYAQAGGSPTFYGKPNPYAPMPLQNAQPGAHHTHRP